MQLRRARYATELIFLVCGLGIASWAPIRTYAKGGYLQIAITYGIMMYKLR